MNIHNIIKASLILMATLPVYLAFIMPEFSLTVTCGLIAMLFCHLFIYRFYNEVNELSNKVYEQKVKNDKEAFLISKFLDDLPKIMAVRIENGMGIKYEIDGKNDFQDIYDQYKEKNEDSLKLEPAKTDCPSSLEIFRFVKSPKDYKDIDQHVKTCERCLKIVQQAFVDLDTDNLEDIT